MVDYLFEKDEYCYYASFLIFGEDSPITSSFRYLTMEPFRSLDIPVSKIIVCNEHTFSQDTQRTVKISPKIYLRSSITEMKSGINSVITYLWYYGIINQGVEVSDVLFKDTEFKKFDEKWADYSHSKIKYLSVLIKALYEKAPFDLPRCLLDFPNIATAIFDYVFTKKEISD